MIFNAKPAIIGHRGCGSGPGENTLESLLGAADLGATWVELDVQRTADDRLVLHHDPALPDGTFVADGRGDGLVRLEAAFEALPPEIGVDLDVKTILEDALDPRTAPVLAPLLRAEAARRPLMVTSFDPALLLQLKDTGVHLGLLTWLGFPIGHAIAAAAGLGLDAVALHTGSCAPTPRQRPFAQCVQTAHAAGLDVMVWCPRREDVESFLGADALVVDDIPGAVAALGRRPLPEQEPRVTT
ncbi:MAG: glycerophosphodiester phosphodiesterase [Streptosporangiaceae bacterium]